MKTRVTYFVSLMILGAIISGCMMTSVRNHPVKVLCFGDSNTYGYSPTDEDHRYPYKKRWTSILQQALGKQAVITVDGFNGRTTDCDRTDKANCNGVKGYLETLKQDSEYDVVVFMLGTNDTIIQLDRSVKEISDGMKKLMDLTAERVKSTAGGKPKIIIVAPGHVQSDLQGTPFAHQFDETSVSKSIKLSDVYRQLAKRYQAHFIDGTKLDVSDVDCIHLTPQGHRQLAGLIFKQIKSFKNPDHVSGFFI